GGVGDAPVLCGERREAGSEPRRARSRLPGAQASRDPRHDVIYLLARDGATHLPCLFGKVLDRTLTTQLAQPRAEVRQRGILPRVFVVEHPCHPSPLLTTVSDSRPTDAANPCANDRHPP